MTTQTSQQNAGELSPGAVRNALRQVIDPEIHANIVDLGLVYDVQTDADQRAVVTMTLTTPHCPMGPEIIADVEKTATAAGAAAVDVQIVWSPPWTPEMMSDDLKAEFGMEEEPVLKIEPPPPPPKPKKKKGLLARLFGG